MSRPHYADGCIAHSNLGLCVQVVFRDSFCLETYDRRILPGLLPQLECATPAPYKLDSLLTEGLFYMQGLLKKFLCNHKLGQEGLAHGKSS